MLARNAVPECCPICRARGQIEYLCTTAGYQVFTCLACQGDFVAPTPSAAFLQDFYSREEWFEGGEPGGYQNYDEQTVSSVQALASLLQSGSAALRSVLDIGCGYGAHLQLAARSGWTCSGVEISDHARAVATERLGNRAKIVATVGDLPRSRYDLVLLLDVIEHLGDPDPLFAELASLGVIDADTQMVITTPNARSEDALRDPANWQFRHPPSHLTYYSERALQALLNRRGFTRIEVEGLHPLRAGRPDDAGTSRYAGLLATASGFDPTRLSSDDSLRL